MSKAALLIGINYKNSDNKLDGCINDVNNVKKMLTKIYKYKLKDITVLTDDTIIKPTLSNIIIQLYNLAFKTIKEGTREVWISYSGHGSYVTDTSGDEKDGKDECLVPIDFKTSGLLKDDIIHHILSCFNPRTKVIFVADTCYSETLLDLQYRYISGNKNVVENNNSKISSNIMMISGCKDNEVSADAYNISNSKEYSGAMTSALLGVLEKYEYNITCWVLLKEMRLFLNDRKFTQIPQICCSNPMDSMTFFSYLKKPDVFITH